MIEECQVYDTAQSVPVSPRFRSVVVAEAWIKWNHNNDARYKVKPVPYVPGAYQAQYWEN